MSANRRLSKHVGHMHSMGKLRPKPGVELPEPVYEFFSETDAGADKSPWSPGNLVSLESTIASVGRKSPYEMVACVLLASALASSGLLEENSFAEWVCGEKPCIGRPSRDIPRVGDGPLDHPKIALLSASRKKAHPSTTPGSKLSKLGQSPKLISAI